MANWNCNDGFKQQKKRNFIYKSTAQNKNPVPKDQKFGGNLSTTQMNVSAYSSPRKKMRSSYSFYDKSRSERQAAEELCSDLPINAFEDDVLDDFGDDLTAEQLCEVAEQTEQQAYTQALSVNHTKIATNVPKKVGNGLEEDYFGDFDQDLDLAESETLLVKTGQNGSYIPFTSKGNGTEVKVEEIPTDKTAVLFSAESCSTNQFASTSCSFSNKANNSCFAIANDKFLDEKKYKRQIKELQEELQRTQKRIKDLEENNYEKDGNLKMLQDSLEHLKSEEVRNKEKLRNVEEQKRAEIKELQKNHAKTMEQLNSKICFQEQEIKQAKEQRQAIVKHHENSIESPKRNKPNKPLNSSVIPTGQSFFERSSTDSRSPKVRKATKLQQSPEKHHNHITTPVENQQLSSQNAEKRMMRIQVVSDKASNVEVAQKLFKLPNTELTDICIRYDASPLNQSLLPLLRLNVNATTTGVTKTGDNIDLQNAVIEQGLNSALLSSESDSQEVCQAIEGIQEMVNTNLLFPKKDDNYLQLVNNFKASNILDSSFSLKSAVSLLPLLEHHISQYSELRADKDEDNLMSTCPSSPVDASEMKDKESVVALSLAFDGAIQSLRCLDVLVSYSYEVRQVLLNSVQVPQREQETTDRTAQNSVGTSNGRAQDEKSQLLGLLFKLAVPHPNEPPLVGLVSFSVLESLAKNCPEGHRSWFFPRLCDTLLPQCLSKEYGLSTLSLVTLILTKCLHHHHVCSQSDDCVLLRIYQGCLNDALDLPHGNRINLQLKVVMLVNSILSQNNAALPYLLDCHCSLELLKLLVCLLNKEMVFLEQHSAESLMSDDYSSLSLQLLCHGIFLMASLVTCTESNRLLADLRILVGHKYNSLIIGCLRLFKDVSYLRNISEVLIDLLDENIEEHEVLGDEDGIEDMEVCE